MASWSRNDAAVADFDDFDPTPYSGGYDITLTFGRPLPPSEETCYAPNADSSSSVDYARPNYFGSAQPSEDPQDYRFQEQQSYGYGYKAEEQSDYSGYGRRPDRSEEQSYGYGNEERPEPETYREEYEKGYGERPRYGQRRNEDEGSVSLLTLIGVRD